ncbi:hypothetical protein FRC02_001295 [Tulasnella sp. 418]|nr:hypothetical protein FRC02_001295 [Tulasnella sp. 418]
MSDSVESSNRPPPTRHQGISVNQDMQNPVIGPKLKRFARRNTNLPKDEYPIPAVILNDARNNRYTPFAAFTHERLKDWAINNQVPMTTTIDDQDNEEPICDFRNIPKGKGSLTVEEFRYASGRWLEMIKTQFPEEHAKSWTGLYSKILRWTKLEESLDGVLDWLSIFTPTWHYQTVMFDVDISLDKMETHVIRLMTIETLEKVNAMIKKLEDLSDLSKKPSFQRGRSNKRNSFRSYNTQSFKGGPSRPCRKFSTSGGSRPYSRKPFQ